MTIKNHDYRDGQKFTKPTIREVVAQAEQGYSRSQLCEQYGVSYGTLERWLREHGSSAYHSSKKKIIDPSVKMGVIQSILQGRVTIQEAAEQLGIKAHSINPWLRTFKQENGALLLTHPASMKKDKTPPQPVSESEQIKALKKALEESQLKVAALETLVTVAERELKIDIRKKSGARQSPK